MTEVPADGAGIRQQPPDDEAGVRQQALVDEAAKKSALLWLQTPTAPAAQAVWHAWLDGHAYVLTGGGEQPDPGLATASSVVVVVRSKDTTNRLLSFTADVTTVTPEDDDWPGATGELARSRLNLRDAEHAPSRWAGDPAYRIFRLTRHGALRERPGEYGAESHRAPPVPSPATTKTRSPHVLHRRGGSGRPLS